MLLFRGKLYRRVKDAAAHGRYSCNRTERRTFFTVLPRSSREIKLSQRAHLYLVGDFLPYSLIWFFIFLPFADVKRSMLFAFHHLLPLIFADFPPKADPLPPTNNV